MSRSAWRPATPTAFVLALALCCETTVVCAADINGRGNWTAMASDRPAGQLGDSLTVLILENSQASNTAQSGSQRSGQLSGQISGGSFNKSGQIGLDGSYTGSGQTGRTGRMVAQISVVVDEILPNGDLHVSGEQTLNINGDHTKIRLKGRVRRADISSSNTVLSTLLADVTIDYGGAGFASRSARPGIVNRLFGWLGL